MNRHSNIKKVRNKKGQITTFVIVGLVILLAAALFFFLNSSISTKKTTLDVPDVSVESRPAVELVQRCLLTSAEKGLRELGKQGGTLTPPKVAYPPYKGEAVLFTPDVIPYWRYLTDCGNPSGCEVLYKPGLCEPGNKYCTGMPTAEDNIQDTLQRFIDKDIGSCINEFKDLGKQYNITIRGKPKSNVIFTEGVTHVFLNYPITITSMSTDNIQELEDYKVDVDVDMYNIYKLATEIINFEKDSNYYERQTMNLVAAYADINNKVLPPMDEVQFFGQGAGPWVQEEIKDALQNDLLPFMSLVRFANTKNNVPLQEKNPGLGVYKKYSDGFYRSFMPKTSNNIYKDFDVNTNYLYEPIYSKVGDGSSVLRGTSLVNIKPSIFSSILQIFLKDYRFTYDISYPLVISIHDDKAFNGEGYSFQFAIEVNVRNNIPGYNNFTYYNLPTKQTMDLSSLMLPQKITVQTNDRYKLEPLEGVSVSYICGSEYNLGETRLDSGVSQLITKMPYCEYGGYIKFRKKGYLGTSIAFNNRENTSNQTFKVDLWPLKERDIIVRKRTMDNITAIENAGTQAMWMYDDAYANVSSKDMVLVNIERHPETPYDDIVPLIGFLKYESLDTVSSDMSQSTKDAIELGYKEGYYDEEEKNKLLSDIDKTNLRSIPQTKYKMEFAPGTYSLDSTLIDKMGMDLPAQTIDFTNKSNLLSKLINPNATKVDFPEQNFSTWVTGGAKLNFSMSPAQVYTDEPIIIYVLEEKKPNDWIEFLNQADIDTLQEKYKILLNPKY